MILTWLAQAPAPAATAVETSWTWKDLGPFAAGCGTLLAAFVAGWFLSRNSKRTPYENLESLSKARAELTEVTDVLPFVDQSIAYALAQIRFIEGTTADTAPTTVALEADRQVAKRRRRQGYRFIAVGVVGCAAEVGLAHILPDQGPYLNAVAVVTALSLSVGITMAWPRVSVRLGHAMLGLPLALFRAVSPRS